MNHYASLGLALARGDSRPIGETMKHRTIATIVADIKANVAAMYAGTRSFDEFGARNRALWNEIQRGELCIIGSACSRRTDKALRLLGWHA